MSFTTDVSFPRVNFSMTQEREHVSMSFTTDVSFLLFAVLPAHGGAWWVSMPFTTKVSFLRTREFWEMFMQALSQCPLQRTSHFYSWEVFQKRLDEGVSMSFTTDVSFLLEGCTSLTELPNGLSQCPLLRTSHFYKFGNWYTEDGIRVSMSFTTDVSFLRVCNDY